MRGGSDAETVVGVGRRPLEGARITLVFEYSTTHNSRVLQEIAALQDAGATVHLLTSHTAPEAPPPGVDRTVAPIEFSSDLPPSTVRWSRLRAAHERVRRALRTAGFKRSYARRMRVRRTALRSVVATTDLFWVIDFLSLPTVMEAVKGSAARMLYETVDLVPEFLYQGERPRQESLALERALVGRVDGFITACDSYADYYVERYGDILRQRPVVRDNSPAVTMPTFKPTERPLRLLFLGSLMFDRPVNELIEAMAHSRADVTLTFQGKNYLAEGPSQRILELGLQDRVRILEPCPPDEIVATAAAYDVGIVALRGLDENERRASTSKLFTYLSAGLAILGSDLPGIARVVDEYDVGLLVEDMDPHSWASGFDRMANLTDEDINAMKTRSLEAARLHSWDRQRPAFVAEFVRALGAGAKR